MNTYYILRHGQTIHHIKDPEMLYSKWISHIGLTKKGKKQIEVAAKKLINKRIDVIYSSDFFRTRQTSGIASKILGLKVKFDKRLRDINQGIYHGREKEEYYKKYPLTLKNRFSMTPEKGENWNHLRKRVNSFLKDIEKKHKNKNVLIVSHGDTLWLLEGLVKKETNKQLIKKLIKKENIRMGELRRINI